MRTLNIPHMASHLFDWDTSGIKNMLYLQDVRPPEWEPIGWAYSAQCPIRPHKEMILIMFFHKEEGHVWFHHLYSIDEETKDLIVLMAEGPTLIHIDGIAPDSQRS